MVTPRTDGQPAATGRRPREVELIHRLRPFLAQAATTPSDVQATALMAYARAAGHDEPEAVLKAIDAYLGDGGRPYRDMLVLALGLVDSPLALKRLTALVRDDAEGRRAYAHNGSLPQGVRAFAAYAMAQTDAPAAADVLLALLRKETKGHADLRTAALHAVGCLADVMSGPAREAASELLVGALKRRAWPDAALGAIPRALLRLNTQSGNTAVVEHLRRFRKPVEARRGAALAMIDLGVALDDDLADVLIATVRRDPDETTRQGMLLSLGELIGRPDAPESKPTETMRHARSKVQRVLTGALRGMHVQSSDRGAVYLATALAARHRTDAKGAAHPQLLRAFEQEPNRQHRNAAILAMGVLGHTAARATLQKAVRKGAHPQERAYAAEALGLLRDREATNALLALLSKDPERDVRYRAARGLSLQGEARVVDAMLRAWEGSSSDMVRTALARALGELGDRRAIAPLIQAAGDPGADDWARRRALSALGMMGEAGDTPWLVDLQRGALPLPGAPTLARMLTLY